MYIIQLLNIKIPYVSFRNKNKKNYHFFITFVSHTFLVCDMMVHELNE